MRPTTMHAKSDSEVTSLGTSSPPRSPPRRALYYVESPSHHELEKMSYNSSPLNSPIHHHYHYRSSPIHHSRESSTSRFSAASLKYPYHNNSNKNSVAPWRKMTRVADEEGEDDDDEGVYENGPGQKVRIGLCFVFGFVLLFIVFSVILWGASKGYRPEIFVKRIVFRNFHVQAGMDYSGVATEMVTLNSTVLISYENKGTFFGVHVTSIPFEFYCYQLKVASGQMEKFYQKRKSHQNIATVVSGHQVPVYGAVWALKDAKDNGQNFALPLNLTFVVRSRAYILGKLVKSKFYNDIRCSVTLKGTLLGKPLNLTDSCTYR